MLADEDMHRHAVENLDRADALLLGRVTYEMMEAGWRHPAPAGTRPDWMEPFGRKIDAAKKYVVWSTLERVDWNAELVRGPTPFAGLSRLVDLELVSRLEFSSGAVALQHVPR
jgi:hypothetical protein